MKMLAFERIIEILDPGAGILIKWGAEEKSEWKVFRGLRAPSEEESEGSGESSEHCSGKIHLNPKCVSSGILPAVTSANSKNFQIPKLFEAPLFPYLTRWFISPTIKIKHYITGFLICRSLFPRNLQSHRRFLSPAKINPSKNAEDCKNNRNRGSRMKNLIKWKQNSEKQTSLFKETETNMLRNRKNFLIWIFLAYFNLIIVLSYF